MQWHIWYYPIVVKFFIFLLSHISFLFQQIIYPGIKYVPNWTEYCLLHCHIFKKIKFHIPNRIYLGCKYAEILDHDQLFFICKISTTNSSTPQPKICSERNLQKEILWSIIWNGIFTEISKPNQHLSKSRFTAATTYT